MATPNATPSNAVRGGAGMCSRRSFLGGMMVATAAPFCETSETCAADAKTFRAGAHAVDITPESLPVLVSGGFLERTANTVHDQLHARCLVLDDGLNRVAIVVVDSCVLSRELLDHAKELAQQATGIPVDRITIAATHTHSAPAAIPILGSRADDAYARLLPVWIAQGIEYAVRNLVPAKVGWGGVCDDEHTHCRVWIRRPDRIGIDPFGKKTIRAMMHPGYQNPDYIGPCGPPDPYLTVFSAQSLEGRPIAMLANYSMHYFGAPPVSADYYGLFCSKFAAKIGDTHFDPPFVAIMSQGTSGDLHWMDYSQPRRDVSVDAYAEQMVQRAFQAYQKIPYHDWVPVRMCEERLTLDCRVPNEQLLTWARKIAEPIKDRQPKNRTEVYALEQLFLHADPQREVKLQAIRVGDFGIVAMPCEVYGITGLKIKAQSPLQTTMNLELANGEAGYIPPPELHVLGGYNTWPARSAALEAQAEPKIVDAVLSLLEQVSGKPRRSVADPAGPYVNAVLASKPSAYWRLYELAGPDAKDASPHGCPASYEDGIAHYLDGPGGSGFCGQRQATRAAHFAGGRVKGVVPDLGPAYTFEAWFWNGLPSDARPVTGYLFSCGVDDAAGDALGIGGTADAPGCLFFAAEDSETLLTGNTAISLRTWNHLVFVRDGDHVTVHLNGKQQPEISGRVGSPCGPGVGQIFVGGRSDGAYGFEGKIAEAAIYARALGADEIAHHFAMAALTQ